MNSQWLVTKNIHSKCTLQFVVSYSASSVQIIVLSWQMPFILSPDSQTSNMHWLPCIGCRTPTALAMINQILQYREPMWPMTGSEIILLTCLCMCVCIVFVSRIVRKCNRLTDFLLWEHTKKYVCVWRESRIVLVICSEQSTTKTELNH